MSIKNAFRLPLARLAAGAALACMALGASAQTTLT